MTHIMIFRKENLKEKNEELGNQYIINDLLPLCE